MSIQRNDWSLQRKGIIDQERHKDRVKEAIRKNLGSIVSNEAIILSDGKRTVKVPIKALDEYKFRFNHQKGKHVGQGDGKTRVGDVIGREARPGSGTGSGQAGQDAGADYYEAEVNIDELAALIFEDLQLPYLQEKAKKAVQSRKTQFNEIRRTGVIANLDKRRMILENIRRNAREGNARFGDIKKEDLRFKTWEEVMRYESNAVVIAMIDVSGSMGEFKKYIARSFYFWMVRFLRTKYDNVDIVFISHHTEAKEVTEEQFFTQGESGGTVVSSAYQLALDVIKQRYRPSDWNIYPFHFSDGDNYYSDNEEAVRLADELIATCNLFGYGEIGEEGSSSYRRSSGALLSIFSDRLQNKDRFVGVRIDDKEDVYPALKQFLGSEIWPRIKRMEDKEIKELEKAVEQIWEVARRFGLDPYPTNFEIVPATVMYEVGSYALPGRYSHWTFGKTYHRMKTMYDFGLSKIYEVVINTNPAYGFLLETNSPIQNKMVIAHVLGHVDFFKNNTYFSKTNRRMVESVSTHAQRMMEYEFRHGRKTVERFLDAVLAIEEHIDPYFFIKREITVAEEKRRAEQRPREGRYDDLWQLDKSGNEAKATELKDDEKPRERLPEKDLLFYVMKNSPSLSSWQRDLIAMVHEEMEYFVPQMQTKIMNEGWASIWHARIMRELDLSDNEHIEFANLHSGVVSPQKGQLNPYYLGYKIYEDIERRWNEPSQEEREKFGRAGNEGREKIFEVRELDNDVSFLRNYLTEELCEELDLFVFELVDEEEWTITEKRWQKVRDQLVSNMTNFGFPYLQVEDGDYNGNRELYMKHRYEGTELDMRYARKALEHVHTLWGRPVHLETIIDEESTVLHFNGDEHGED